jgi:hypothetical protein
MVLLMAAPTKQRRTIRYHDSQLVLTAKDIAEAIAFKKDRGGFPKALRQVKHWTDKGLLRAITPLDTGSGVAREYVDEPTVLVAAILQELVLLGCTIEQLQPVSDRLYEDYEGGDPDWVFFSAMTDEFKGYLALEYDVDSRGRLKLENVRTFSAHPDQAMLEDNIARSRSSILIDLAAVANRISWPGAAWADDIAAALQ